MKKNLTTILLFIILFIGLSLLLYPSISDYWNSFHQSRAIVDYTSVLNSLKPEDYTEHFNEADEYNSKLAKLTSPLNQYQNLSGYNNILDVTGTGIIGYVTIPKIDVEIPFYHGTEEKILTFAAGHIEGTSFPTGGSTTHTAISAHRGLPSARLFTDLNKIELGDIFTLTVLDREITFEVDQILIVEPAEIGALGITEGHTYCTLITCTPYGINSHRMLVRGRQIDSAKIGEAVRVTSDAIQIEPIIVAPFIAIPILLFLFILLFLPKRKK